MLCCEGLMIYSNKEKLEAAKNPLLHFVSHTAALLLYKLTLVISKLLYFISYKKYCSDANNCI